ncbi:piriformospora indica-insensitive protein 2-like [Herrania umbratica]|uniref:Piriformospora indica-insensitive protein 2-like n=1 Tax=Herrania umbratica TaxID=108875 RepID=A0A6J1B526_9ROSI|nr:piriformospora indica-insensitive protein 2-like [Herrania umbratica]
MASPSLFLVGIGFLVVACGAIAVQRNVDETGMVMEEGELLGLFDVMGSLLEEPGWADVHPEPCTDTPWPGVECEIGQDPPIFHVTTIHIGPDVATPPCKPSAKISDSLLKLPYLRTLSIFNCFVTSQVTLSPTLFGSLSSLEHLSLQSNPSLSGEVPQSLAKISTLRVMSLSQNNLQGNIPLELGGLVNLEQLDLSYNNLSGEIPEDIGGLKSLTILDLSSNGLEGPVPHSLGQLQLLQKVDLCSNRLHGRIPPEFGQLNSFSACGLMGPIPNSLSSLKNLTALSLDNNSLTGTIPPSLGSLPNLDQLNLSHNKLSGELLLSEEFIKRLGKRLDVRGNSRLCTSYQLSRKNISTYLQTPACLGTEGIVDNRTCPEEQPDDFKGRKPYWYHGQTSSRAPLQDPQFISTCFVLLHALSFL